MALNEELLSKFTQNELGDLLFDGRLILKGDVTAPEKVTNLIVESVTAFSLSVSFSPSVSTDLSHYEVSISEGAGSNLKSFTTSETSMDFSDLVPNKVYEIRVVSVDSSGNRSGEAYVQTRTEQSEVPMEPDLSEARLDVVQGEAEGLTITFVNFKNTDEIILWVDTYSYNGPFKNGDTYYYPKDPDGGTHSFFAEAKNKYGMSSVPTIYVEY